MLNALAYGLTSHVLEAIKEQCCKNTADEIILLETVSEYHKFSTDNATKFQVIETREGPENQPLIEVIKKSVTY